MGGSSSGNVNFAYGSSSNWDVSDSMQLSGSYWSINWSALAAKISGLNISISKIFYIDARLDAYSSSSSSSTSVYRSSVTYSRNPGTTSTFNCIPTRYPIRHEGTYDSPGQSDDTSTKINMFASDYANNGNATNPNFVYYAPSSSYRYVRWASVRIFYI